MSRSRVSSTRMESPARRARRSATRWSDGFDGVTRSQHRCSRNPKSRRGQRVARQSGASVNIRLRKMQYESDIKSLKQQSKSWCIAPDKALYRHEPDDQSHPRPTERVRHRAAPEGRHRAPPGHRLFGGSAWMGQHRHWRHAQRSDAARRTHRRVRPAHDADGPPGRAGSAI